VSYLGLGAAPTTATHVWVPPSGSTPGYWRRKTAEESKRAISVIESKSQQRQCIEAGIPSGVEANLCAKRLAQGDKLEDVVADYQKRKPGTVRDKRIETLTAECINAGVPEAYLQICIAARQQGYSLDQAAGAALEQAAIAARKRKRLILIGAGGVAVAIALFTIKKKKGRK